MPASTTTDVFDAPPIAVLWPILLAGGVYLVLRSLIRGARGRVFPATAFRHALCVGVIGWLVSSLLPAANAGILPVPGIPKAAAVEILPALAWPVLGCLAVHSLGQLSYPRPKSLPGQPHGQAPRSRDFLPLRLAWTAAAIFAVAAAQIVWTSTLPGFAPQPYGSRPDGEGGFATYGGEGRVAGVELAMYLGGALFVLAVGTLAVLLLISRRPPVDGLTPGLDGVLRTIAMNRLLRTVATIASGLAAIAGNHAARPDPGSGITGWINPAGALNLAVLLVMLLWPPPKLAAPQPQRRALAPGAAAYHRRPNFFRQ